MRRALGVGATRVGAAGVCATMFGACASPGTPPGGPERHTPPKLLRVSPDPNAVGVRPREVVFTFDAVLDERSGGGGEGATGLSSLVTVSPRSGSVAVDWRRERLAVRPRQGFRPNVTYTVTVLPGLRDLRSNVRDSAAVAVFSTGGPIAAGALRGVVFDWVNGRPAARAVVEASGADSVTYVALADSAGRFVVPHLPPGRYLVRGTVDLNGNRAADPREAFDTVRAVAATPATPATPQPAAAPDTGGVAVYAFPHDTLAPRLTAAAAVDSATVRIGFDRPLRPDQPLAGRVRVAGADSVAVQIRSILSVAAADSAAQADARAAAPARDTAPPPAPPRAGGVEGAPPRDQGRPVPSGRAPAIPPPRLGRPVPPTELVVRLATPLRANTTYRVRVQDVRSLAGVAGTSDRTFTTPRAAARAPARPPAPTAAPPVRRP